MTRSGTDVWKILIQHIVGLIVIYLEACVKKFFVGRGIVLTIRMYIFA